MRGGDKNGLSTDPVHVDAGARLKVIQVDVAIFGDEKDNIMLGAYLEEDKIGKTRVSLQYWKLLLLKVTVKINNINVINVIYIYKKPLNSVG